MRTMCDNSGFRERYAIMHGEREIKTINSHKCYVFTYSDDMQMELLMTQLQKVGLIRKVG